MGGKAINPTPLRNFRIPDSVYDPATAIAALRGESLTDTVVAATAAYVAEHEDQLAAVAAKTRPCAHCRGRIYRLPAARRDAWRHRDTHGAPCGPAHPGLRAEPRGGGA